MKSKLMLMLCLAFSNIAIANKTSDIEANFKKKYPNTTVTGVKKTPVDGIYEISMGKNIAYTDKNLRYFIFGHMYDMETQKDITTGFEQSNQKKISNKIDVKKFNLNNAILFKSGNSKRNLYIFSDPDCPYCSKLEKQLILLEDVNIYVFPYPILSLHPDAGEISRKIWCSPNRQKAWRDYVINKNLIGTDKCDNPIDENIKVGNAFGINGTPTLINDSGKIRAGAINVNSIESFIDEK